MTSGSSGLGADNPFRASSDLPFGLPPFGLIRPEHYRPAFEAGMAEQRAEVEAIATADEPATFADTVEALERSGALLTRVSQVFFNLTSSMLTDDLATIEAEVTPLLAAHADAIHLDRRLFARLDALHAAEHDPTTDSGLDAEQRRLLDRYHTDSVRAGAALDPTQQARLREINAELATLGTAFKNDLLADTVDLAVHVTDRAELDGLPDGAISAAEQAAAARGLDGYLLTLGLPSSQPELELLTDRGVRERLHRASIARG
ncbi:MAG: M3 family peptidase, partial [Kineosporiaceae bacterium]